MKIFFLLTLYFLSLNAYAKPNFVFILVDDLDKVITEPFYEQVLPKTLELKKTGIYFENSFVTTPLCCPSRAAILSGRYAHNTNVYNNGGAHGGRGQFIDDEDQTIAAHLFKAGYKTTMIGKYLNGFHIKGSKLPSIPYGWEEGSVLADKNLKPYKGYNYTLLNWNKGNVRKNSKWDAKNKTIEKRGEKEEDYSTDVIYKKTIGFLERAKKENRPFFAYVNPTCPHLPLPPAKRHLKKSLELWSYDSFPTDRPNYFKDGENLTGVDFPEDKPKWLRNTWKKRLRLKDKRGNALISFGADAPKGFDRNHRGYNQVDWFNRMGSLYACDELVDGIVTWLKENDKWDDTYIIFTSDNGYNLGAHGLSIKMVPYEESLRVPLIISGGKNLNLKKGVTSENWTLNVDFAPTLMELAGLPKPNLMDGVSLVPLIKEGHPAPKKWRDKILIEYITGIANGHLSNFYYFHLKIMPAYFMDIPIYKAIRAKKGNKTYLFVEWDKFPHMLLANRALRNENSLLNRRIRRGDPRAIDRMLKAQEKDYELYDIDEDPFQLRNLLYYEAEKYQELKSELQKDLKGPYLKKEISGMITQGVN